MISEAEVSAQVAENEQILTGDNRIVKIILKMRDAIAEKTKAYEAEVKVIELQKEQLENELLKRLQSRGSTQTKTEYGTAFLDEQMSVTIADDDLFRSFVLNEQNLDWFQRRVKVETLREYQKENDGRLPPGLSTFRQAKIKIRKS